MKQFLAKNRIIPSKRQPKNLKRLLTTSQFTETSSSPTVKKCHHINCGTCDLIIEGDTFHFSRTKSFRVRNTMDCTSSSVIYCMQCAGCQELYIGQTGGPLQKRVTVHKQHISTPKYRILQVSEHIANCAAGLQPQFKIYPFYKAFNMTEKERETREQHFIRMFKPSLNSALY